MEWKFYIVALLVMLLALTASFMFLSENLWVPKHNFNEPPLVPQRIPYIGHVAGLFLHGMKYFELTSAKCKAPIYTLNVLSKKLYVVTSPELVAAVSRNSKSLSFNPFISEIGVRLTRPDEPTRAIIKDNLNGERGQWGYVLEVHDLTVTALGPGKDLDFIAHAMLVQTAAHLHSSEAGFAKGPIKLYAWSRHLFTMCSTTALYGPDNPFNTQSELEEAFWDFDNDLNLLLIDIAPAVIARKGHKGRHKVAHAFKRFYENDPRGKSSSFAEARYTANAKYGMSTLDMGRLEVGSLIGVLVNTVPTVVYMLYHIFSDEALLQDIRAELETSILPEKAPDKKKALHLNLPTLKEKSPLLQSTFQEVLRVYSRGASSRLVMEDTVLNNQYLLQKGSILMMPTAVIHSDRSAWGRADFQARRFLLQQDSVAQKASVAQQEPTSKRSSAASYRPFGGGATLCPGRHFASAEILALTAMVVYKYDLTPTSRGWSVPKPYQTSLATNIFPPKTDIEVRMRVRPGLEETRWTFDMN